MATAPIQSQLPKSFQALQQYSVQKFTADLISGVTVGLVALPLAMAFSISSGLPPQAGLYCAVVAGFIISALGGSMVQIGGPTGAFVVVVAGIIQKHGVDGLYMCTLMAGVLLMVLGLTGLGAAVKFIPRPVVLGFTNGIAILIASTEVKDFFGIQADKVPGDFVGRMGVLGHQFHTLSPTATFLSVAGLAFLILMAVFVKRVPGSIIYLFAGTAVAWGFRLNVATIESKFGGIPGGLPTLHIPHFDPALVSPLLPAAFTVAMLGSIESLLSAVVADKMSGDKHNPNVELFAQGVANIFSPLFGGLPATGAIARTATNVRSGGKTPVAGMIHALTLLVILVAAAPLAKHIPLAVLASILMMVCYNMGEWREVPEILKQGKADIAVWIITFMLTVFADLTVAVEAGMILAALLYIGKVTATTSVTEVTEEDIESGLEHSLQHNPLPPGVSVFRIHGPFLFGSTDKLDLIIEQIPGLEKIVMLRLRNMNAIDATGLRALEDLAEKLRHSGRVLVLCGARAQPARLMEKAEFHRVIGEENICSSVRAAAARATEILGGAPQSKSR